MNSHMTDTWIPKVGDVVTYNPGHASNYTDNNNNNNKKCVVIIISGSSITVKVLDDTGHIFSGDILSDFKRIPPTVEEEQPDQYIMSDSIERDTEPYTYEGYYSKATFDVGDRVVFNSKKGKYPGARGEIIKVGWTKLSVKLDNNRGIIERARTSWRLEEIVDRVKVMERRRIEQVFRHWSTTNDRYQPPPQSKTVSFKKHWSGHYTEVEEEVRNPKVWVPGYEGWCELLPNGMLCVEGLRELCTTANDLPQYVLDAKRHRYENGLGEYSDN